MNFIESDDLLTCSLPARLDTISSQAIETELVEKIENFKRKIIFDFSDVTFISSYFLRILLNALKKVGVENLEVVKVSSEIKKVFKIAGFDKYLNIN